jgi:hypothetical protein
MTSGCPSRTPLYLPGLRPSRRRLRPNFDDAKAPVPAGQRDMSGVRRQTRTRDSPRVRAAGRQTAPSGQTAPGPCGRFSPGRAAGGLTGSIDSTLGRTSSSARSKRTAPASGEVAGALREGDKSPVTIRPRKSVTGQKDRHATYSDPQLVVRS